MCCQNFLILFQDFPWIETDEQENEVLNASITPIKTLDTGLLKVQMYVEESDEKWPIRVTDGSVPSCEMSDIWCEQTFSGKCAQCHIIHHFFTPYLYWKLSILFYIHRLQWWSSLTCYFNDIFSFLLSFSFFSSITL